MGKCKDCGKPLITWWGSRCWVCTGRRIAVQDVTAQRALVAARRERRNRGHH